MRIRSLTAVMMTTLVCIAVAPLDAVAQNSRTITVVGVGKVSMSPTHVLLRGQIEGRGETGQQAFEKFQEKRSTVGKQIRGDDNNDKLRIDFEGEKLMSPSALEQAGVAPFLPAGEEDAGVPSEFAVVESVVIRVEIENDMERQQITEKLTKMVDRIKDAGIHLATPLNEMAISIGLIGTDIPGITEFAIDDPAPLRMKAYEAAVKDARERATRLAMLAEGKLGSILSIEELGLENSAEDSMKAMYELFSGAVPTQTPKFSSDRNRPISIEQELKIVFQLAK